MFEPWHNWKNGCGSLFSGLGQNLRQGGQGLGQLLSLEVLWVAAVRLSLILEVFLSPVELAVRGADEHSCSVRPFHSLILVLTQSHP